MISPVKIWRHQREIASFLSKEGKIISWTVIYISPGGYEQEIPYPVVLVQLQNGKRMVGQLVDWVKKDLRFGRKVKIVYRRTRKPDLEGVIPYGVKFRVLQDGEL